MASSRTLWLVLFGSSIHAQAALDSVEAAMRLTLERAKAPAIAAAIAVDGRIVWQRALGVADPTTSRKVGPSTPFALASITKTFTATALVRVLDEFDHLDVPIGNFVRWSRLADFGEAAREVTLRRILDHTAGLPRFWRFHYDGQEPPALGLQAALDRYGFMAVRPGTRFHYSNLGLAAVQLAIEKVAGTSYREILRREVFDPLELEETVLAIESADVRDAAIGVDRAGRPVPFYVVDHPAACARVPWPRVAVIPRRVRGFLKNPVNPRTAATP